MEYKITEVKSFSEQTYGRANNHRVVIRFEGQEKDYSAFVQVKPNVGDVWNGEIKKTEKDDKIYWNFEFAKNTKISPQAPQSESRAANILEFQVIPMLQKIYERIGKLEGGVPEEYPQPTDEELNPPF